MSFRPELLLRAPQMLATHEYLELSAQPDKGGVLDIISVHTNQIYKATALLNTTLQHAYSSWCPGRSWPIYFRQTYISRLIRLLRCAKY